MLQEKIPNFSFQTVYASREVINCPFISEIIRVMKRFEKNALLDKIIDISISIKYGKRVLINAKNIDFFKINSDDFIEVVDYDPIKKVLLCMGSKEPRVDTPIHWLIHHARDEVNAIIQIESDKLINSNIQKIPKTKKQYQKGTLEQAKDILLLLRDSKIVEIKNQGLIFVGDSIKYVEESVLNIFEELK